jgi:hypothetical protein
MLPHPGFFSHQTLNAIHMRLSMCRQSSSDALLSMPFKFVVVQASDPCIINGTKESLGPSLVSHPS